MVWKILLGILLFILLLLLIPLRLSVSLTGEGDLSLRATVLYIPVWRSPRQERKIRLRDYSPRALERRRRREERKAAAKQAARAQKAKKPSVPEKKAGLGEKIGFITDLARTVAHRSLRRARIDVDSLHITVGTEDAATTALLCGALAPALSLLFEALRQFSNLHIHDLGECGVTPDFTATRTRANIRFHYSMHVWHVFDIALHTLLAFLKHAMKPKRTQNGSRPSVAKNK